MSPRPQLYSPKVRGAGPVIRGPGPAVLRLDGGEWTKYRLLLGLWSKDRGLSKTIQRQLSSGNAEGKTLVRAI